MSLPAQLQSFAAGPAEVALAKALSYDRQSGLALVAVLAEGRQRSHLEALGEVSPDKDVKKAARAAAYKLKSAGVAGGVQREAAVDLSVKIETSRIAAATVPGFDGRLWLVLPTLPGVGGGEIDLREHASGPRIDPIAELSIGRVRKFQSELAADKVHQPPVLIDLDLAARLVAVAQEALALSGKPVPPAIDAFSAWHKRAMSFGAQPERASARAALGPGARPLPEAAIEALASHELLGFLAAPASAFDGIDKEFRALLHGQEAIEKEGFTARAKALVDSAAQAWWVSPNGKKLAAADDLLAWEGGALEHPLTARAFSGAVDLEAAWMHREAHMRGDAHHGHE